MSFASMRGQTLFVGNLVGEGIGIDFSDGSIQTTAYPGNLTSGATIPNQIIIKIQQIRQKLLFLQVKIRLEH